MHSLRTYVVEVEVLFPDSRPNLRQHKVPALNLQDAVRTAAEDAVGIHDYPVTAVCDGFTVEQGLDGIVVEYWDAEYGTGGEHDQLT